MSVPLLPPPAFDEPTLDEYRAGCEFIDGERVPKEPTDDVDAEFDREGCEFIDGEWVEKDMSYEADFFGVGLLAQLNQFVRSHNLGRVQGPECGYQCFGDDALRVRKPDVSFISKEHFAEVRKKGGNLRIAPDFAAEVISPNEKAVKINLKVTQFLKAGVRLIWIIFHETRSVWILRADGSANWVIGDGQLSGEDVIPGFTISLDSLFSEG